MKMADWVAKLDGFLTLNDRAILDDAGRVTHELAVAHAEAEYEKYQQQRTRTLESDFDKFARRVIEEGRNPPEDEER